MSIKSILKVLSIAFINFNLLYNGNVKFVYYLKVMKTGLKHPCRTFVSKYLICSNDDNFVYLWFKSCNTAIGLDNETAQQ